MTDVAEVAEERPRDEVVLRTEKVTKLYPGTTALKDVDFNVYRGRVNVLVGENGAGKSTLMKIIAGVERPSGGRLLLEGEEVAFSSVGDAADHGIGIIFQELNLFPNLNVAKNIFMAREIKKNPVNIDHKGQIRRAAELLKRLEQDIDPKAMVGGLRIGQQQIVEIAKALSQDVSILIMDEPTSALSSTEVEVLFRLIDELKSHGVSIIYISHRLEELVRIGDYITVLRDGAMEAEAPMGDIDVPWIIDRMVGDSTVKTHHSETDVRGGVVLEVDSASLPRPGGGWTVDHVSFSLHAGEIIGVYGLMGGGRSELFECLMGVHPEAGGSMTLAGEVMNGRTIGRRIRAGMALIPEDRQREGLVQSMSVAKNMTLSGLWLLLKNGFHISRDKERDEVDRLIGDLSLKAPNPGASITSLSGGNQQKVVIGKGLLTTPKVLLMDEPTRGIDVGAKADVFSIMRDLADKGLGILFATSELKEIQAISDRVIVMSNGRMTGMFSREEATEEVLVAASAEGHGTSETKGSNKVSS